MPLLWRYLLRNYLQVFILSVAGFISVLLVTRFQSIARFASTGAPKLLVLKFVLIQIPFVLPLAIPISCLIASMILFQRMSQSHELTALRSAGLSFVSITYPLISCAFIIAALNFTIISEVSPKARTYSKSLAYQMAAVNPLCLLQKDTLIKLKEAYIDMKVLKSGKYAEDVCFIMRNLSNQRLALMLAKKLELKNDQLIGKHVTFISAIDPKNQDAFDHLVIENQAEMHTQADNLSQYLVSNNLNFNYENLNLRLLQAKSKHDSGKNERSSQRAIVEFVKRFSLGLSALSFTIAGIACGVEIVRQRKLKGILWAIGLMALFLISFLTSKSINHTWVPNLFLLMGPHVVIFFFCYRSFKNIAKGVQ